MKIACILLFIIFAATLLGASLLFGVCIDKEGKQ